MRKLIMGLSVVTALIALGASSPARATPAEGSQHETLACKRLGAFCMGANECCSNACWGNHCKSK